jgi:uncharacterized protein YwgA
METVTVNRRDWLLLLVGAPWEAEMPRPIDRVRVQKALFVLSKEAGIADFYSFVPYHYGPFCKDIYSDAEGLARTGNLVEVMHCGYRAYLPTRTGRTAASEIQSRAPEPVADYVRLVREWVERHSFNSLVRAVYERWPDTKVRSIFTG